VNACFNTEATEGTEKGSLTQRLLKGESPFGKLRAFGKVAEENCSAGQQSGLRWRGFLRE
jgi:hypothetical protein